MNITAIIFEYRKKVSACKKGFTLVELLVVIAVIGVLATVILVAINPLEQLARTRDAGRKQTLGQIGNAIQSYYTAHNATYPAAANANNFLTTLTNAGEFRIAPQNPAYTYNWGGGPISACADGGAAAPDRQNNFCYDTDGTNNFVAYVKLESRAETDSTDGDNNPANGVTPCPANRAVFLYDSTTGKSCKYCLADANSTLASGTTYCN